MGEQYSNILSYRRDGGRVSHDNSQWLTLANFVVNLQFDRRRRTSWAAEQLLASAEVCSVGSMTPCIVRCIKLAADVTTASVLPTLTFVMTENWYIFLKLSHQERIDHSNVHMRGGPKNNGNYFFSKWFIRFCTITNLVSFKVLYFWLDTLVPTFFPLLKTFLELFSADVVQDLQRFLFRILILSPSLSALGLLLEFKKGRRGGAASHHSCSFLSGCGVSCVKATDRWLGMKTIEASDCYVPLPP